MSSKALFSVDNSSSKFTLYFDQQCDCYVVKNTTDVASMRDRIYEYYNYPENLETEEKFQLWKQKVEEKIDMVGMSKLQLRKEDSEIHRINISIHGNLARIPTLQDFNKFKILLDRFNKNSMIDLDYKSGASYKPNQNYASSNLLKSRANNPQHISPSAKNVYNLYNNPNTLQVNNPTAINSFAKQEPTRQEPVFARPDDNKDNYTSSQPKSMKILSKGKLNPIKAEQNNVNLGDYTSAYQSQMPYNYITRRVDNNKVTREPVNDNYLQLKSENDRLLAE